MHKQSLESVLLPMQKHIKPLNMNGMQGRMLRMSAPKKYKREILLVYGHHASLERMYGIAEALNEYGAVTMPDLPGFGGMDSFYKIGMKPTLDTMADYLASFVKLKYRNKNVSIFAMSLGFVIVTRMLQRYPELVSKVDILVSVVGFSHKYDLKIPRSRMMMYRLGSAVFRGRLTAAFFYNVILHPFFIRLIYNKSNNAKMVHLSDEERRAAIEFEVELWRKNEVRTYMHMTTVMMTLNNCTAKVALPVHHISVESDQYFDHSVVEQHMRVIFDDFTEHVAVLPNHAPSILASKEEAKPFIPKSIKKLLSVTKKRYTTKK